VLLQATLLHVVPPLVARVLQQTEPQQLRQYLSTVRNILSSALALRGAMVDQIINVMPGAKVLQSDNTGLFFCIKVTSACLQQSLRVLS